jgi:two-component system, OmpR family, response regulator
MIATIESIEYANFSWKVVLVSGVRLWNAEVMDEERWTNLAEVAVPIHLVLVVEDDVDEAQVIKILLERHGLKVRIAKDGGQAQSTFVTHRPDFVILDLMQPGESGFEICERLKHTDDSVPVLILSAIDLPEAHELATKVGADGYLNKPYNPEILVSKMREVANTVWERNHLPQQPDATRVRFVCACGKKFKVSSVHRGKNLTCPQCGEPVAVPRG